MSGIEIVEPPGASRPAAGGFGFPAEKMPPDAWPQEAKDAFESAVKRNMEGNKKETLEALRLRAATYVSMLKTAQAKSGYDLTLFVGDDGELSNNAKLHAGLAAVRRLQFEAEAQREARSKAFLEARARWRQARVCACLQCAAGRLR